MNVTTVSLSEARKNLSQLVSNVSKPNADPISISVRGRGAAMLISQTAYEKLLEDKYRSEFNAVFDELDEFNKAMRNK